MLRTHGAGVHDPALLAPLERGPSTVRTHMENLFRKLACNSRAAATLEAAQLGLIAPID
jgi:DNA-binding CsgD family transcriptional regulator